MSVRESKGDGERVCVCVHCLSDGNKRRMADCELCMCECVIKYSV